MSDIMIDEATLIKIRSAVRYNEIGDGSPYRISFAGKGNSGGSFGVYQGDAHSDQPRVTGYLTRVLHDGGMDGPDIVRIVSAVSGRCLENPLNDIDTAAVNRSLSAPNGVAEVDEMDTELESTVANGVRLCMDAAGRRRATLDLQSSLYIACWTNMTGVPHQLAGWLGGALTYQLNSPAGAYITGRDLEAYLGRTDYFSKNPQNFLHLQQCVARAMN